MESLTSVELNYMVYRYLQESGFEHSAFSFGFESGLNKSSLDGNFVPPGALIKCVQKGLQYVEMEANLSKAESNVDEEFTFLQPLDLITKDVTELYKIVKDKNGSRQEAKENKLNEVAERTTGRGKDNDGKNKQRRQGRSKDRECP